MLRRFRRRSTRNDSYQRDASGPSETPPNEAIRSRSTSTQRSTDSVSIAPDDTTRRGSQLSPFSSYRGPSPGPEQRLPDTLGLHVVHQPSCAPSLDIIFVHGLGGASRKTWSKFQDPSLFWPGQWLPQEPEICQARIFSFGYNASFRHGGPNNISNIGDFAKDLLFEMRFGKDEKTEDLGIGKVPIIFVVHSLGGLIVKKAFLLGQNDENFQDVVKSISAIMFLATPHRGTNLADLLNKILVVSLHSPKNFIVDLNKNSPALEELNEQFRHIAPKLSIVSFYETLQTSVGPKKLMVLEKDSSILGYPGEISKSLNADHHDVCKYTSQEDSNYVNVRNALKSLVTRFRPKDSHDLDGHSSDEIEEVKKLLGLSQNQEDDFSFFRQRWMPGTCEWTLSEPEFILWSQDILEPCVTWLNAPPASGKSVLSTYIIDNFQSAHRNCQYFYFRFGDQTKRSISALLRCIAFQLMGRNPEFKQILTKLLREGTRVQKLDALAIWQKLLVYPLSRIALHKPLYWVIDALDEADSPKVLPELLQGLSLTRTPIRVFIVSRRTESLSLAFDRLSGSVPVHGIHKTGLEHIFSDIRLYVEREMKYVRGSNELKQRIMESILQGANGNFLWVHLVLEEISSCHTQGAIQQTLEELPPGMEGLYQRMEQTIITNPRQADRVLAETIISWTICTQRSLSLEELSQALLPEFPDFLDLRRTILDVCGQFIIVDQTSHVAMVHQSARDFLIRTHNARLSIDVKGSHGQLFEKSLALMLDPHLRHKIERDQYTIRRTEPFLFYAATCWPYHLRQAATGSGHAVSLLVKFFKGPFVLAWIQWLALFTQLEVLVKAARNLASFVSLNRRLNIEKNPLLHRLQDLELLELWAIDLLKMVGKFGRQLLHDPSAIYKMIPPFCPQDSMIYRQFNNCESSELSISGISNRIWNDCLARIMLHDGAKAWRIICAGRYFAVLSSTGTILLGDAFNLEEIGKLSHREHITAMCFNNGCDRLVSCGVKTTKVWAIPSGEVLSSIPNPASAKAMTVTFAANDERLLIASDDKVIRFVSVTNVVRGWQGLDSALLKDTTPIEGGFITSPSYMAFNADATQIAVAYRGFPLSVWSTSEPRLIGRCKRVTEHRSGHSRPSASWMAVDRVAWNPVNGHLVGLYKDGCIFKWDPIRNDGHEVRTMADEIEVSPDGKLFVTSDSNGTVKVWSFAYFSIVYQLSSENLVTGLTFSPDCRRFYDLRGSSINVWEPNSLVRLSENEESLSDTASEDQTLASISQTSEAWIVPIDPIYVLAAPQRGSMYCVGSENGLVDLFDTSGGKLLELMKFSNFLTVNHLAWSEDGKTIVASDLGGNIVVKYLNIAPPSHDNRVVNVQPVHSVKIKVDIGGIHQVLLNRDSTKLLVLAQEISQVWSVENGCVHTASVLERVRIRRWTNHPIQTKFFIGVGPIDLKIFCWSDLSEAGCISLWGDWPRLHDRSNLDTEECDEVTLAPWSPCQSHVPHEDTIVSKLMHTQDGQHLLVQVSEVSTKVKSTKGIIILPRSSLEQPRDNGPRTTLRSLPISDTILNMIEVPLGVLPGSRLVFLDKDLWMCTIRLEAVGFAERLKRHFFVPRDWASTEALDQCCILEDGTFLLPKDGEVAIITSALGSPGW